MKVHNIHPVLQPRQKPPVDWRQPVADSLTVAAGSVTGAFYGPLAGATAGAAVGASSELLAAGHYPAYRASDLVKRQAMVGSLAGLSSSLLQLTAPGLPPLLGVALGAAVGGLSAALIPGRPESPHKPHWNNLQATQAPELWKQGLTGEGVTVAVLDTGSYEHPALQGRVVVSKDFIGEDTPDPHHHSMAMAGIIAGHGKDGEYPAVAPNANLAILRVADAQGKVHMSKVVEAIEWARENRQRYNIQVLNLSFTADAGDDPQQLDQIREALGKAASEGLIPVASAGNLGPQPAEMQIPAATPWSLAVASYSPRRQQLSDFSNRSRPQDECKPTVASPGEDWLHPGPDGGYLSEVGTSHAAAALSGVVALWKQSYPDLTVEQAREALQASARPLTGLSQEEQGSGTVRALEGLRHLEAAASSAPR